MFMKLIRSDTVELEYVSVKWLIRWSMTPLHQFKVKLLAWSTTESPHTDGPPPYTSLKQACPYKQYRELGFEELECISLVKKAPNLFFNDSNLQECMNNIMTPRKNSKVLFIRTLPYDVITKLSCAFKTTPDLLTCS